MATNLKLIYNKHKISVNFTTKNCGYVAAYRYVCKDKPLTDVLHGPVHSAMSKISSPVTKNTIKNSNQMPRRDVLLQQTQKKYPTQILQTML